MAKTIEINFDGYYTNFGSNKSAEKSGIYCIYKYNKQDNKVKDLIYIGESEDVNERLKKHNRWDDWTESLNSGEALCYSFGAIAPVDRERAEAALIFQHAPEFNSENKENFSYIETSIVLKGKTLHLKSNFTLKPTNP
ncbi:GIY-YIG nuclease family protein [uncultured Aeromonas sp.]|uniref:GIY-YIG nuclease family protein n=1 Tax=uncultured Aeromonas sp. TaxID=263763 RepID=UPI00258C97A6|nr:GIY-YIG nuclease family protein [uncultured Aeromonas sp.]